MSVSWPGVDSGYFQGVEHWGHISVQANKNFPNNVHIDKPCSLKLSEKIPLSNNNNIDTILRTYIYELI